MISDDEMALIDAIHADPKSDAPRLEYADWLAANDERDLAEFIKLHCRPPYFDLQLFGGPPWQAELAPGYFDIKERDPERVGRAIELLGRVYGNERLPEDDYFERFRRGLPLLEVRNELYSRLPSREEMDAMPLARYAVLLHADSLQEWLDHPVMSRADVLRYCPGMDWEAEVPRLITGRDLRALSESPLARRLTSFRPCGHLTEEASEVATELLGPLIDLGWEW